MFYVISMLVSMCFLFCLVKIHNFMCKNKEQVLPSSYDKKDLELIDKIKNIICNKISDDYMFITKNDFESIDLFEETTKGHKIYNNRKLVDLIKKAISEIKSHRQVYVYGRCDTNSISFIVRNSKFSNKKICNHCGFHINELNSKCNGISETAGYEYECGNCGKLYDSSPIDNQWNKL